MGISTQLMGERLARILENKQVELQEFRGELTLEVPVESWLECARTLRDHDELSFEQATDLCGIDYLGYGSAEWQVESVSSEGFSRAVDCSEAPGRFAWNACPPSDCERRFAVVVHLLSIKHNLRLRIRCYAPEQDGVPVVPSLVDVWAGLDWYEREAFDLYGIAFEGHPDMRRILTDYGFIGHPFRKDFPLSGNVEVRYDENLGRVIYEPVKLEPRVGVPRVVRDDARYQNPDEEKPNG